MLNAVSRFLTEGKLSLFPAGVTDPQISAWVMNPSTTGLTHAGSQDPPPPVGVLPPLHFPVLPPPNADPAHSLGKALNPTLRESKNPCSSFLSQTVESVCVGFGSGNSPTQTTNARVLCDSKQGT